MSDKNPQSDIVNQSKRVFEWEFDKAKLENKLHNVVQSNPVLEQPHYG